MDLNISHAIALWLIAALVGLVVIWPAGRICARIGLSPVMGVLAAIPVANICLLWYVALCTWPRDPLNRSP